MPMLDFLAGLLVAAMAADITTTTALLAQAARMARELWRRWQRK